MFRKENGKPSTFIAGLRHNRMTVPMVIEGAMNGAAFLAYIEQILGPTLKRGDIVGMDNCGVHKVAGVDRGSRCESRVFARILARPQPN